jgi:hypothetical protein
MVRLNDALMPQLGLPGGAALGCSLCRKPYQMLTLAAKRVSRRKAMEMMKHCHLAMLMTAEAV